MDLEHPSLAPSLVATCMAVAQIELGERTASLVIALANIITAALVTVAIQWLRMTYAGHQQLSRRRRKKSPPQHMVLTERRRPPQHGHRVANASVSRSKRSSTRKPATK